VPLENTVQMPCSFKRLASVVASFMAAVTAYSGPSTPLMALFDGENQYPFTLSLFAITPAKNCENGRFTLASVALSYAFRFPGAKRMARSLEVLKFNVPAGPRAVIAAATLVPV